MSAKLHAAASVTPPVSGRVYVRATVASQERIQIPDEWRGGWVTFTAEGEDVYIVFGDSTVAALETSTSTLTGDDLDTPDVDACEFVPKGTSLHVDLRNIAEGVTHFSHISVTGGGGYLRMRRSDNTQDIQT